MKCFARTYFAAGLVIILSGCATPSKPHWYKEGVDKEITRSALAECRYEIGMRDLSAQKEQEMLRYCMERNGFRLRR
ncbi:hypothetical protein RN347_01455 [Halomonas sp. PAMB 3264]|uniref:hypothetical protein n=1 Tax=unclassified Halomonas TaxID=2609666 RepID=UPI00289C23F1|nr:MULTISPECIES: hypothetical protein [unclassified Halomonas]WNL39248.1 hypothetical protein RN346_01465 [Halomonas sp. PAMB 3232]WNL42589.1 hypothetical protein RN347_01455 [Halomonas sp. PAMB 3264]